MTDGIIKYNFDFTQSAPLPKARWETIEKVRQRLYTLKLIGEKDGIGYGNISQRAGKKEFVITGTQTGHLCKLNQNHYSLIEDFDDRRFFLKSSAAAKPSSEALTHATIYTLSDEIKAVIHIHSKKLWDFMLEKSYLKTEKVPYGSIEMIEEVKRIYAGTDPLKEPLFVMHGHEEGIIAFGRTLEEAEQKLFEVVGAYLCD